MLGFLGNVALGYVQEKNIIAKEEAAAASAQQTRLAEFLDAKALLDHEMGLKNEAEMKKFEKQLAADDIQSTRNMVANLPEEILAPYLAGASDEHIEKLFGKGPNPFAAGLSNTISTIGKSTYNFSGVGGTGINIVSSTELDPTEDTDYETGKVFWGDFEAHLQIPENRNAFFNFFSDDANADALKELKAMVMKNENFIRIGFRKTQFTPQGQLTGSDAVTAYDLRGNHPQAVAMFESLGLASNEEGVRESLKHELNFNEETEGVLFLNVAGVGGGNAENHEPVILSKTEIDDINVLAQQTGFTDAQDLALATSYTGIIEPLEGQTRAEVALDQNYTLRASARLNKKHGQYLRGGDFDPGMTKQFYDDLIKEANGSQSRMVNMLAMMSPVPSGIFTKPKKNVFATNENYQSQKTSLTVGGYLKQTTEIKPKEFELGYTATKQTLELLDRLIEIETKDLAKATGTIRSVIGFGKRVIEQFKQAGEVAKDAMGLDQFFSEVDSESADDSEAMFGNKKKGTTDQSLKEVVAKLKAEGALDIDLADLSEADALRLSLAAKMARAIDPAGRLSNQDFEIQLRRLGEAGPLNTPQEIARALATVKAEFEMDLANKTFIYRRITSNAELTPGAAKKIDAYFQLRGLEAEMFGAGIKYEETKVSQDTAAGTGAKDTPAAKTGPILSADEISKFKPKTTSGATFTFNDGEKEIPVNGGIYKGDVGIVTPDGEFISLRDPRAKMMKGEE